MLQKEKMPVLFVCECSSLQHQIAFEHEPDENVVYARIHLIKQSFWKRLKAGLRYIFGYHCKYGHWDEFIFRPDHAERLQQMIDRMKPTKYQVDIPDKIRKHFQNCEESRMNYESTRTAYIYGCEHGYYVVKA